MVCSSCQKRLKCLPAQMAQGDEALTKMLGQLKGCDIKARNPLQAFFQRLKAGWQGFWSGLRHKLAS